MVIFGLGFLYTFLERLTHCGSGYTLYIAVLCAQVHILVNGWLYWNAPTSECEIKGAKKKEKNKFIFLSQNPVEHGESVSLYVIHLYLCLSIHPSLPHPQVFVSFGARSIPNTA